MTRKLPLMVALAAFAMACSDPTTPVSGFVTNAPSLGVSTVTGWPFPIGDGVVELCKTSNVGGDFDFDATGPAGTDTDPDITIPDGGGTVCVTVYTSALSRGINGDAETVTITETNNTNLTSIDIIKYLATSVAYTPDEIDDSEDGTTATLRINDDMARRVTFTNTVPDEETGCTYTKGWYRNNGSSTVIAVDGRTIAEAQAIFAATPGKPGTVTFGGNNTLLNLYQQLLAALNNLGGDANASDGPDDVDQAIIDALAGTGGTGTAITTTLTQDEMSDLIETLSDFNEGYYEGWPHCDDN